MSTSRLLKICCLWPLQGLFKVDLYIIFIQLASLTSDASSWVCCQLQSEQYLTEAVILCREQFELLLQLRYSSPLFRLPSAAAIKSQVHFWNTGPDQVHSPLLFVVPSLVFHL